MRTAQPLGPAEHALLGLISLQPRHGYELAAQTPDLERQIQGSFPHLLRQMRLVATSGTIDWLDAYRSNLKDWSNTQTPHQHNAEEKPS
jgi:hypothetical protein